MAETDLAQDAQTPSDDLSPEPAESMGDGLFEEISTKTVASPDETHSETSSDDGARHSAEASQDTFDPSSIDFQRVDVSTVPEQYRGLVTNAQQAVNSVRSDLDRQNQELATRLRDLETQQQQSLAQNTAAQTIAQLNQHDEFANLTPEQSAALETVRKVIGQETAGMQGMPEQIQQMQQTLQALQQQSQQQQQNALLSEANAARAKYGGDVDRFTQPIMALISQVNPMTGQVYSITEAYEAASGKTSQAAQAVTDANNTFRTQSKQQLAPAQSTSPASVGNDTGELTREDLQAGLGSLGFEL